MRYAGLSFDELGFVALGLCAELNNSPLGPSYCDFHAAWRGPWYGDMGGWSVEVDWRNPNRPSRGWRAIVVWETVRDSPSSCGCVGQSSAQRRRKACFDWLAAIEYLEGKLVELVL